MRKATGMLLAIILTLFGLITPLTAQAATAYRIGQIGSAWFQSVTDAETTDLYADWNGLQTQLPNTGGILRHGLIGTLIAGMGLAVWTMGRRRASRR